MDIHINAMGHNVIAVDFGAPSRPIIIRCFIARHDIRHGVSWHAIEIATAHHDLLWQFMGPHKPSCMVLQGTAM